MPFLQGNYDKDYEVMKEMYKSDKIWAKIVSSQNYFGSEGGTKLKTRFNKRMGIYQIATSYNSYEIAAYKGKYPLNS